MAATAKKLLSVFLAFVLVFAFTPTIAFGEGEGDLRQEPLEAGDLVPAAMGDEQDENESGDPSDEVADSTDSTNAAVLTAAATSWPVYNGFEGYKLGFVQCTYTPAGEDASVTGAIITDVDVYVGSGNRCNVVIPAQVVVDDDTSLNVIGLGAAKTSDGAAIDRGFTFSKVGDVDEFTFPEGIRFVTDITFRNNVQKEVAFAAHSNVTELSPNMFEQYQGTAVTLPDSLVAVPSSMFHYSNIEQITLPNSVRQINYEAFYGAYKLQRVELNSGLLVIGDRAFASEPNGGSYYYGHMLPLTNAVIPNSVTDIQHEAFAKDIYLTSLKFVSDSNLTAIGDRAFYGTSLTSVSIPDAVTSIGTEAFSGGNGNNNIGDDSNPNTRGAYTLTSVDLGTSQTASRLTTLGSKAFAHQPITSVALPNTLTSLGYDSSTYTLTTSNGWKNGLNGALGAFSGCDQLTTVTWPTSSTMTSIGGFDGCASLTNETVSSLPSWVETIDAYAFYNCTSLSDVRVPKTVKKVGKGAFAKNDQVSFSTPPTYTLLNKGVGIEWDTNDIATTSPFPLACGATIKYPRSADADSSIVSYRHAVEAYEAAQNVPEANRTKFATVADNFYTVTGHVPEGASVTLIAGDKEYHPALDSANSFTTELIEGGTYVGAVVSLEGYADYRVYPGSDTTPDKTKSSGVLDDDWTFTVTTGDMTLVSQLGILQVTATGENRANCNIAVFDSAGRLVSQGGALRCSQGDADKAPVYTVDDIPADTYTVVGWQENEYFSRISSIGDFAAMGFDPSDYARADAIVAAGGTATVNLAIPPLDTSKIAGVLATGEVVIPSYYNPPEVPFVATISYDMTTGQSVDGVKVSIPDGMVPCAAATNAEEYYSVAGNVNTSSWNSSTHILTIGDLNEADRQSGTIALSLKATKPGSYAVSATLESGDNKAPIGAASVECPAIRLVAPQGTLQSREFTVDVYAAPGSNVQLKIGDTVLEDVTCTTNFVGHAKVSVKIPDEEISTSPYYLVAATLADEEADADGNKPNDTAIVQYNAALSDVPFEPTIHDFWFESAGEQVWLAKEGKDLSGGYYIVGVHEDNFTREMPFTVAIDSLQPLEDTTTLYLGMLDNSVVTHVMYLSETSDLKSGAKRYLYKTIVPITENDEFLSRNIPCRFDVIPGFRAGVGTVQPELSASNMGTLKLAVNNETDRLSALGAQGFNKWFGSLNELGKQCVSGEYYYTQPFTDLGYEYYSETLVTAGYDYVFGVFNESFRHEKWDPDNKVWPYLSDTRKAQFEQAEDQVAAAYDALALLLGDSKPMYAYPSFEAYLKAELGYASGGSYSKDVLAGEGYLVIDDLFDNTWSAVNVDVPDDGHALPTLESAMMTTASTTADDGRIGSFQTKNGKGEAANKRVNGKTDVDIVIEIIGDSTEKVMDILKDQSPETARVIDGFAVKASGFARSVYESVDDDIKSRSDYTGIDSELTNRKAELERMQAMDEFYNEYNPGSLCQKALQAEIDYMKQYIADLEWAKRFAWYGEIGTRAGGAAIELSEKVSELADSEKEKLGNSNGKVIIERLASFFEKGKTLGVAARQAWGTQAALPSTLLAPDLAKHRAQVQQWRFYRERECKKDDFGKLHYNKKPIIDPSGYTYEGVEDNRVSDVIATIYRVNADGSRAKWDAAEADQENPQNTTSAGLFAWDVPEGDWQVLFQKAGYDDVWSKVMHVLPQWTNVAINMLRADPPKGASASANADDPEAPYVDIAFDQYMKTAAEFMPTVTVDGVAVENATWVNAATGTDEKGNEASLSLVLRVPLAGLAEPGDTVTVSVSGAYSYAGKQMAEPYSATVTIPDNASYFYVAPDEVVAYTKGSNEALSFTFKRTSYDNRTFERFEGILVDGAAVDASSYTAVAGSVVVTLKAAYLETLAEGDHALTAQFADGSATADFKVVAATKAAKTRAATPATGDRTAPMGMLLLVAGLACCAMLFARNRMTAHKPIGKHARY
ncbi:MAG: leucine-rich repeat protein [Eggerthellaceae bacterium]|nr:leucine-rich repeat protein [Eggerthellaceae bacterium]